MHRAKLEETEMRKGTKRATKKTSHYQPPEPRMVTLVNYILDKSGSMQAVKSEVLSGFREYLDGLKKGMATESELYFSLTLFDSSVLPQKPYLVAPVETVLPLTEATYFPNGMTALYDAIGNSIRDVDEVIRQRGLKVNRVLTIIHTDGEENSSREFGCADIRRMREEKEATGHWTFVYIGASPTTYLDAEKLGIARGNTMKYDADKTSAMYGAMASATAGYRASVGTASKVFFAGGAKFIDQQRVQAKKRHEHLSSDGVTKYTATEWEDGTWSCNCPGWANRKKCKHIGGGVSAVAGK